MIVVIPLDPPWEGLVLSDLVERTELSAADGVSLYEACATDVLRTVARSGGEVLVNYRDDETLPKDFAGDDPAEAVTALVDAALDRTGDVRLERQVGSTPAARLGNTVTHLLEREGADSVGWIDPTAPLVTRTVVDGAAMALRRHDVVLGPDGVGGTYLAGFTTPIDFGDLEAADDLLSLARSGRENEYSVGFAPTVPRLTTVAGLAGTIASVRARRFAERHTPAMTKATIDNLGLTVGGPGVVTRSETTDR